MLNKIVKELRVARVVLAFLLALIPALVMGEGVLAQTTADVTVNATPAYVSITSNVSSYNFGIVAASSTTNTSTSYFGITNASTVQTDQTIRNTGNWTGGPGWTHNDSGSPGDNATAIKANKAGVWGVGDIIVRFASPNFISENQGAGGSYAFGLGLWAPTVMYDGAEKSITIRITAVQG